MTDTDRFDASLRKHLEAALSAVPESSSHLSDIRKTVSTARRRRRGIEGGLALAIVIALTLGLLSNAGASFAIVSATKNLPGMHQPTPRVELRTTAGASVHVPSNSGQWLVLAFVTPTGCPPCVQLERGLATFERMETSVVNYELVLVNEGPGKIRPTPRRLASGPWSVTDDFDHHVAGRFDVTQLPLIAIVDPAGRLAERIVGAGAANAINTTIAPSLLKKLTSTTVGGCSVTISLSSARTFSNDPSDIGEFSYSAKCPGYPHEGTQLGTLTPPWQTVYGEGGSGTNPGYFSELYATTNIVAVVELMDPTTGKVLSSMVPVWDDQFGHGFAALLVPSSEAHMGLLVKGLDASGAVVATDNWTGYS